MVNGILSQISIILFLASQFPSASFFSSVQSTWAVMSLSFRWAWKNQLLVLATWIVSSKFLDSLGPSLNVHGAKESWPFYMFSLGCAGLARENSTTRANRKACILKKKLKFTAKKSWRFWGTKIFLLKLLLTKFVKEVIRCNVKI